MIKEINGQKYSRKEFPEYEKRVKIKVVSNEAESFYIDLYTTETNELQIFEDIKESVVNFDKARYFSIINTSTKAQDDAVGKIIDEWINSEI